MTRMNVGLEGSTDEVSGVLVPLGTARRHAPTSRRAADQLEKMPTTFPTGTGSTPADFVSAPAIADTTSQRPEVTYDQPSRQDRGSKANHQAGQQNAPRLKPQRHGVERRPAHRSVDDDDLQEQAHTHRGP